MSSQENQNYLSQKFSKYSSLPREIIYAHINKSTLVKGEMLGYSIYVFDKFDKGPSTATTNMYCTIKDSTGTIVKEKLLMMDEGFTNNVFKIDSLFTSGTYKFSAYTNYMQNFNEFNHFETEIIVIDPKVDFEIENKAFESEYTIQILPEGGHIVTEVQNTVAIIVKDQMGYGLKNANGYLVDDNNTILSEFKLDQAGIAKTILIPQKNKNYRVIIPDISSEEDLVQNINQIDFFGINMSVSELRDKVNITFRTNEATLPRVQNKNYILTVHNGSKLNQIEFNFANKTKVIKIIDKELLFSGMNIFTVFDNNHNPILERLYFNHNGISTTEFKNPTKILRSLDSINVDLDLKTIIDTSKVQNISVSILPSDTKSYTFKTNILSKLYLEPYIKGHIENPSYYFTNNSKQKVYELDNLLIAQGWSSYNWKDIFNSPPVLQNSFEYGITATVNVNNKKKAETYISSPLKNNTSEVFVLSENDRAFYQKGLFPLEDETYKIVKSGDGISKKPNLYVIFNPSQFPKNTLKQKTKKNRNQNLISFIPKNDSIIKFSWDSNNAEKLDEVLIIANKEKTKTEELESQHFGAVDIIDQRMKESSMTMAMYLTRKGYNVRENLGQLSISVRNPATPNNTTPVIYFDGVRLSDFNLLANFRMSFVDYVVIDKVGAIEGVRGANGVIKIFTNPESDILLKKNNIVSEHQFPLSFSSSKKYYTPNYKTYNTPFYRYYGAISWIPNLKVNKDGITNFTFFNSNIKSINLYIEGFVNNKTFISQILRIDSDN